MENRYNRQSRAVDVKPHSYHPCHKCHNHYGKQNMVSFIRLFIILKLLSCGVSNVIVALWWLTRWYYNGSHLAILMWKSFEDSVLKPSWALHCDVHKECHNEVKLRLNGNRNTAVKSPLRFFVKSHQVISFFAIWGIRHNIAFIMILQWTLQMTIAWESRDFFLLSRPLVILHKVAFMVTFQWSD